MTVCRTQTMSTGPSVRTSNPKTEISVREEKQSLSMQLSTFSTKESQTCEMLLQLLCLCHICCIGGSYTDRLSPAGNSRGAPMMPKMWFTAQCAGKGQVALTHLKYNCLEADYMQTFSFSFTGTDLWTIHILTVTNLTTNMQFCSNGCTHDVFSVLVYHFLFP